MKNVLSYHFMKRNEDLTARAKTRKEEDYPLYREVVKVTTRRQS